MFIEIRCRRPEKGKSRDLWSPFIMRSNVLHPYSTDKWFLSSEFRKLWDLILAVMSKLFVLSRQWPGLTQQVHTPCPERGCSHYFTWRDWQELDSTDLYNLQVLNIFFFFFLRQIPGQLKKNSGLRGSSQARFQCSSALHFLSQPFRHAVPELWPLFKLFTLYTFGGPRQLTCFKRFSFSIFHNPS